MSSPAIETETHEPALPAVKRAFEPAVGRRLLALGLIVVGAASLLVNLGLLAPDAQRLLASFWPAGVIVIGVGLIVLGDQAWRAETAKFSVPRGQAEGADLLVSAGTADFRIESLADAALLLTGDLPQPKRPAVTAHQQHTTVRLEPLWHLPSLSRASWSARLADDLPWHIDVGSSTGNLELDLRALAPAGVRARSLLGDIDLNLPLAGGADLDIRLVFGDLNISVPADLGVKVVLHTGALAEVARDERRFIQLGAHEIGTPLYAVAARRCTLQVWLGTGHLRLK